jgi:hypothetical protein
MKKITLLLVGLMASGMASEATTLTASGQLTLVDCPTPGPLIEDVNITLSTGVVAGFGCAATTVAMSACHTAGRTTARSSVIPGACTTDPDTLVETCAEDTVGQVTGPAFPTASTASGTVKSEYPVADVEGCLAENARTHAATKLP